MMFYNQLFTISISIISAVTSICIIYTFKQQIVTNVNNLLISLSYKAIHFYSRMQINYSILKKIGKLYIEPIIKNTKQIEDYHIHFVKNGNMLSKHSFFHEYDNQGEILSALENGKPESFDFLILYDNSKDKNNRIIFENIPINLFYVEQDASCRFISCELEYNNIKYDMILKTNIDNFNIVKNRIDNKFVIYYLKNMLNISVDDAVTSENIVYTINIIDQNVNLRTIGEKEQLVFLKNNYYSY